MELIDLSGKQFGRLVVLRRAETVNKRTLWVCRCGCGKEVTAESYNLRKGHTQSCGCLKADATSAANKTHGLRNTRLYRIWNNMKTRCFRESYHAYKHYGGRGITVCDEWLESFKSFYDWAMSNGYQDDLSIDRIDNDEGYNPSNCRWVTMAEQNKNKRQRSK